MLIYVNGDAARPQGEGPWLIAHICNDNGSWEGGFMQALSVRTSEPEAAFQEWASTGVWEDEPFGLGAIQTVRVNAKLHVVNMVAQHGVRSQKGVPPVRYGALETCFHKLLRVALQAGSSIHMPRIGDDLATADWNRVEQLIAKMLNPVKVYVYHLDAPVPDPTS